MSLQIPRNRALTDEERAYLLMRGEESRVKTQDQQYPADMDDSDEELEDDSDEEPDDYDDWTVPELQAQVKTRVEGGATITPASSKKADLIAALRQDDAANAEAAQ